MSYTYDPAGQTTSVSDVQDAGGSAKTDTQCFAYDYLQRLTQAWTDTGGTTTQPLPSIPGQGGCTNSAPDASDLGGPDPYWQSFGYDATGNRTSATDHSVTGDASQDATTSETYPAAGADHPHAVNTATTTGNGGGVQSFKYDAMGNTTEIQQAPGTKTLASGATLASGNSMVSDGVRMSMQADGNLAIYSLKSGQSLWSTKTGGHPGAVATMGTDGALTVHTADGTTLWSSGTSVAGAYAQLLDDGQLTVSGTDGSVLWTSSTGSVDRSADDIRFAYDDNGRLSETTQPGADGKKSSTTTYFYDAAGNLLARDDDGTSTLFLGADQLTVDVNGTETSDTRYYAVAGAPTAVRTATKGSTATQLSFEAADPHGTALTDITADNTSVTRRAYTPFGQDRTAGGNPTTWPGDQGFVGGTPDPTTGLTNLGAREYDPALGRFLSVDPVLNPADAQSLNGYAYADNTPVDASDPSGLMLDGGGDCGVLGDCNADGPPASDCPPFCSPDGQPHGGSTAINDWFDNVDYDIHPAETHHSHHHNRFTGWVSSAAQQTSRTFVKGADVAYHVSGASDVVGCATDPSVRGCATATVMTAGFVLTGGEDELEIAAYKGLEEAGERTAAEAGEDAAAAGVDGVKCSFTPTTAVLMDNGKTKPIGDVKPGDHVEAADPGTGRHQGPRTVTATHVNHDHDLIDLTVQTSPGTVATIHTTSKHPFWDDTLHTWIPAGRLTPGHSLETNHNTHVHVTAVHMHPGAADMYNLTVNQLHTYYVLAGATPVLVHNSGGCLLALRDWSSQRFQFGNQNFLLDKKGMEHILTRHHPKYWDGSVAKTQSFLDPSMSVGDVQDAIGQVMRQNRDTLIQRGSQGMYQIRGNVNGTDYVLGMNRGRVGQFYPESP